MSHPRKWSLNKFSTSGRCKSWIKTCMSDSIISRKLCLDLNLNKPPQQLMHTKLHTCWRQVAQYSSVGSFAVENYLPGLRMSHDDRHHFPVSVKRKHLKYFVLDESFAWNIKNNKIMMYWENKQIAVLSYLAGSTSKLTNEISQEKIQNNCCRKSPFLTETFIVLMRPGCGAGIGGLRNRQPRMPSTTFAIDKISRWLNRIETKVRGSS